MMLALRMQEPDLALSDDEAKELGEKIAEVQRHYPTAVFDPKYAAIAALVVAVLKIEGPRAARLVMREKSKKDGATS